MTADIDHATATATATASTETIKSKNQMDSLPKDDLADFVAITEDGGLKKRILKEGQGPTVPNGSNVEVHYVGTLYPSGTKFDASRDRNTPFNFGLGKGQVIKGWDVGVASMRVGELAELLCEPEYGYGKTGSPPTIPANAVLKFEVEVLGYEEVANTPEQHWSAAQKKRAEGNTAFKSANIANARSAYQNAVKHLAESEGVADESELKQMKIAVLGNLAMCCLKLGENEKASKTSQEVLELDNMNVKAWYRLGQASIALAEFDQAVEQLKKGIETLGDSAATDLKTLSAYAQRAKAEATRKEKALYKNMFGQ